MKSKTPKKEAKLAMGFEAESYNGRMTNKVVWDKTVSSRYLCIGTTMCDNGDYPSDQVVAMLQYPDSNGFFYQSLTNLMVITEEIQHPLSQPVYPIGWKATIAMNCWYVTNVELEVAEHIAVGYAWYYLLKETNTKEPNTYALSQSALSQSIVSAEEVLELKTKRLASVETQNAELQKEVVELKRQLAETQKALYAAKQEAASYYNAYCQSRSAYSPPSTKRENVSNEEWKEMQDEWRRNDEYNRDIDRRTKITEESDRC